MRIIFLNTWYAQIEKPLWEFLRRQSLGVDYVFVSPEVKVIDFSVPNIEISDHLPLILDFEV